MSFLFCLETMNVNYMGAVWLRYPLNNFGGLLAYLTLNLNFKTFPIFFTKNKNSTQVYTLQIYDSCCNV